MNEVLIFWCWCENKFVSYIKKLAKYINLPTVVRTMYCTIVHMSIRKKSTLIYIVYDSNFYFLLMFANCCTANGKRKKMPSFLQCKTTTLEIFKIYNYERPTSQVFIVNVFISRIFLKLDRAIYITSKLKSCIIGILIFSAL